VTAGSIGAVTATLAPSQAAGAISNSFTYTFKDNSSLNGASANVGSSTITVTGGVYNYAAATLNPTNVNLGNIHAGDNFGTTNLVLSNSATGPAGYVETLGADFTNASGVSSSGSVSGLTNGSSSSALAVTITNNTAGAKSGTVGVALTSQAIAGGLSNSSLGTNTVTVSGGVYNYAAATLNPTNVNLGNIHAGDNFGTTNLVLSNSATGPAGYVETLGAVFINASGVSSSGSVSGLTNGSSSSALAVTITNNTAGAKIGSVGVALTSEAIASGLSNSSLGSQTVTVTGGVYNYAAAGFGTTSIDLGNIHAGGSFITSYLSVTNTATGPAGYVETLAADFANPIGVSTSGSVSGLNAGSINSSMGVSLTDNTAGSHTGTVNVDFNSQAIASGLSNSSLGTNTVTVSGGVYNYAVGGFATTSVNLGNIHQDGAFSTNYLSVTNTASGPNGYVETLAASFTNASGVITSGSVSGLAAGKSTNTLGVSLANGGFQVQSIGCEDHGTFFRQTRCHR
jgi:hypothetical protein